MILECIEVIEVESETTLVELENRRIGRIAESENDFYKELWVKSFNIVANRRIAPLNRCILFSDL